MSTTNKLSSSCSSIPSMKPNLNARNSESKDPTRRSFSGNPFAKPSSMVANSKGGFNPNTPANSPSDFPRRSSFGRENSSSMRDFEDKENSQGSNLRPGRVQSPASVSKGTKNFMSPTISAASKFTTSPRKKILVERSDSLRSSVLYSEAKNQMEDSNVKPNISSIKKKTVSFSDVLSMLNEDDLSSPKKDLDEKKIEASRESTITNLGHSEALPSDSGFDLKNDVGSSWETVTDCVNLPPTFKISPTTSCSKTSPMLAPLDADPLMPPYDPKTNYLSPRPQFLHYKPNPRIELMHCKDRDGKRLEEIFISENLSDSEVSTSLSEESQKEPENVYSDEAVKEEGERDKESIEEEEELSVSEMIPISTHKLKSRFFTRSMFIALLLALVFACLSISITDSPVNDLMLKDVALSNLYVPPEITEFAKVNFEELSRKSRLWASNSLSYACKLISELRGVHKLGHSHYGNLTSLLEENHLVDAYPKFGRTDAVAEFNFCEYMLAPKSQRDVKDEANEEDIEEVSQKDTGAEFEEQVHQDHTEAESEGIELVNSEARQTKETTVVANEDIEEVSEEDTGAEFEEVVQDHTEAESEEACVKTVESYVDNDAKPQTNIDVADQTVKILEVREIQPLVENDRTTKAEENTQNTEFDASLVDTPQIAPTVADQACVKTVESYVDNDAKPQTNIAVADQTVKILEVREIQPQVENDRTTKAEENTQNTEFDASLVDTPQIAPTVADQTVEILEVTEIQPQVENDTTTKAEENTQNAELDSSATADNVLTKNVMGMLVLLSLLAATAFFIQKKKAKLKTPNTTAPAVQPLMTKKLDYSQISVSAENALQEKPAASRNWQTEVDDMILEESCPSEMSSFSSSHNKGLKESSEAQSQEMKPRRSYRRESLASSDISLSSYSYGSFTTYEKVSSKHKGHGDDEVATPVRRSSRIRKQVTSP